MKYSRIVAEFYSRAWALREETLFAMQELIRLQAVEGLKWTAEEIRQRIDAANAENGYVADPRGEARFIRTLPFHLNESGRTVDTYDGKEVAVELPMQGANGKRASAAPGSVGVIPITGIISHRMNMMSSISGAGGTSIEKLTAQFRQALGDTNCKAIVFDVDSPGGSVEGVMELASEIFAARKQKPITAVVNSMACSAAYWLASAANEIVCTPSGQAGSIGVYMTHQDESEALAKDGIKVTVIKAGKYKTEGNPSEPLSDEARAAFQSKVNDYYGMFVKAVAQNRGTSQAAVRDGYGQGRSVLAAGAVKEGLVDRVGTMDDVLGKYGVKASSQFSASESHPESQAGAEPKTRAEKLKARTNPEDQPSDSPDDNNDSPCGCTALNGANCLACQSCDNENAPAKADGEMGCACACNACKACDGKVIDAEDAAAAEKKSAVAMSLARRRRQMHLL
jgi:signal peptide peptidase SppA